MSASITDQAPGAQRRTRRPRRAAGARVLWLLIALAVLGLSVDLALHSQVASVATWLVVVLAGALITGLATSWRVVPPLVAAVVVGGFAMIRTSPWLLPLDLVVVGALLLVALTVGRGGRYRDVGPTALTERFGALVQGGVRGPQVVAGQVAAAAPAPSSSRRVAVRAVARGLVICIPLVVVLAALLASADGVFASFFQVPGDPGTWPGHLVGWLGGVWLGAALVWAGMQRPTAEPTRSDPSFRLGGAEVGVVLAGLVLVYAAFAWAQVLAASGGEAYILSTTGLTRAAYARTGFFQLLWAAGITFVVLLVLRRCQPRGEHPARAVSLLYLGAVGLTLVVVGAAQQRLALYDDAFGTTMLRLFSTLFAWWLGTSFLILAAYLIGRARHEWWFLAIGASAVLGLVAVNLWNPERQVVERNVARVASGAELDVAYLAGLSDDAVPAMVAAMDTLPPATGLELRRALCRRSTAAEPEAWFEANRSVAQANEARAALCSL